MAANPWHPRVAPLMLYVALLGPVLALRDWVTWAFVPAYTLQALLVIGLLWRYRKLLPEITFKFHWSAIPAGLLIFVVWLALGYWMIGMFPDLFGEEQGYNYFAEMGHPAVAWSAMMLRLAVMAMLVPIFEELFNRSLTLRSFHRPRQTAIGVVNLLQDLPLIGDAMQNHDLARRAGRHEAVFAKQFNEVPLGKLSVFGIAASTFVFMLVHAPRDYPAVIVCGITYCLVVGITNNSKRRLGLGPVIWTHAITNAALWVYTVYYHFTGAADWRFFV